MKNILKITLIIISASILSIGAIFAKDRNEVGFITMVRANNIGPTCFLELSNTQHGKKLLGGMWSCDSVSDQSMFQLASFAKWQGLKMNVLVEDNGEAEYNQLKSIEWSADQ